MAIEVTDDLSDVVADLRLRCDEAISTLQGLRDTANDRRDIYERCRLSGKIEGVGLILDWLRSY